MGWGICFALDENGYVYCADGCKWRARKSDYVNADYPSWPSARQAVLDYFEGPAHSELDMIRDEFPGTAEGLRAACEEHIGSALQYYWDTTTADERKEAHEAAIAEFKSDVDGYTAALTQKLAEYKERKKAWTEYKKNPPKVKPAKTRADELRQLIAPLKIELELEEVAEECDRLRRAKTRASRQLNLEKKFKIDA